MALKMIRGRRCRSFFSTVLFFTIFSAADPICGATDASHSSSAQNLIGTIRQHIITKDDTLLDVARMYDLGFNEIQDLYPGWDPWLPPVGTSMTIPSQWIVPADMQQGILVNLAELRLYFFDEKNGSVLTFPIGIGDRQFPTPEGEFQISAKFLNLHGQCRHLCDGKYDVWTVPAGSDNPLGEYWLGLDDSGYGIHGTNFPWSIGRLATQGCIRLYPEDIKMLFRLVETGTKVRIIYQPVKIINHAGEVFIEVHRDVYHKIGSLRGYALSLHVSRKDYQPYRH